jgi:hypothetical protein
MFGEIKGILTWFQEKEKHEPEKAGKRTSFCPEKTGGKDLSILRKLKLIGES